MAQWGAFLCKHKDPSSIPRAYIKQSGAVAHAYGPVVREVKADLLAGQSA